MIGLKRHTVRIVEHDPEWLTLGAEACEELRRAVGDMIDDVQHVGSTAVPDLPAKPILDIVIALDRTEAIAELLPRLTGIGYIDRGDGGDEGGWLLVRESSPDVRTIHLHVVERDDPQWRNYLRFRDLLRANPDIRRRYADLKARLRTEFPNDRESYTAAKDEFVKEVLGE